MSRKLTAARLGLGSHTPGAFLLRSNGRESETPSGSLEKGSRSIADTQHKGWSTVRIPRELDVRVLIPFASHSNGSRCSRARGSRLAREK
eukprot:42299-Eustigmatos_ZCMA.PRE.1